MKTIYNLQIGDSYWVKHTTIMHMVKLSWVTIHGHLELIQYNRALRNGIAFLTKEECQRSIDYDVALAKINKRVSELKHISNLNGATLIFLEDGKLNLSADPYKCGKLTFKNNKIAKIIVEELPEEVKTVLGVD